MSKIITDREIHVGEIKCWKSLHNLFSGRALLKDYNDGVKWHTGSANTYDSINIFPQRDFFSCD